MGAELGGLPKRQKFTFGKDVGKDAQVAVVEIGASENSKNGASAASGGHASAHANVTIRCGSS